MKRQRSARTARVHGQRLGHAALVCGLLGSVLGACDGCGRGRRADKPAPVSELECTRDQDCADDNACTREECRAGSCATSPVNEGTSCDDGNVCDGISTCDGRGTCRTSAPPQLDDGNACTVDSCDPLRGPMHAAVNVDDFDECTRDECDPRTGQIMHATIDIDDGDDCTFDSCDPKEGVKHRRANAFHTCDAACGDGFHAAARARSPKCGSNEALQTFCAPSCGKSFHSCDARCPEGYEKRSGTMTDVCGSTTSQQIFCLKN